MVKSRTRSSRSDDHRLMMSSRVRPFSSDGTGTGIFVVEAEAESVLCGADVEAAFDVDGGAAAPEAAALPPNENVGFLAGPCSARPSSLDAAAAAGADAAPLVAAGLPKENPPAAGAGAKSTWAGFRDVSCQRRHRISPERRLDSLVAGLLASLAGFAPKLKPPAAGGAAAAAVPEAGAAAGVAAAPSLKPPNAFVLAVDSGFAVVAAWSLFSAGFRPPNEKPPEAGAAGAAAGVAALVSAGFPNEKPPEAGVAAAAGAGAALSAGFAPKEKPPLDGGAAGSAGAVVAAAVAGFAPNENVAGGGLAAGVVEPAGAFEVKLPKRPPEDGGAGAADCSLL